MVSLKLLHRVPGKRKPQGDRTTSHGSGLIVFADPQSPSVGRGALET